MLLYLPGAWRRKAVHASLLSLCWLMYIHLPIAMELKMPQEVHSSCMRVCWWCVLGLKACFMLSLCVNNVDVCTLYVALCM